MDAMPRPARRSQSMVSRVRTAKKVAEDHLAAGDGPRYSAAMRLPPLPLDRSSTVTSLESSSEVDSCKSWREGPLLPRRKSSDSLMSVTTQSSQRQTPACSDNSSSIAAALTSWQTPAGSENSVSISVASSGWRLGSQIGAGSYGSVFRALNTETGHIFVVKQAAVEKADTSFREKLEGELNICKSLRHKNIVSYLGHDYDGDTLYIHLEYVSGGSVASLLKEFGPFDLELLKRATKGMLKGLDYLHTHKPPVVHRDIKGANILIDEGFCAKLADFGCSKRSTVTTSFTTLGSVPWMAPEVFTNAGHGRKADIWSLGCTMLEMATAEKPWGKSTFDNVMFGIRKISMSEEIPPIPDSLDVQAKDLFCQCLQRSSDSRPSSRQLLRHEFMQRAAAA